MTEMTTEAWSRLILDAYRQGLADAAKQTPTIGAISSAEMAALESDVGQVVPHPHAGWETQAFRQRLSDNVVAAFWSNLREDKIKWRALSLGARRELDDAIRKAVDYALSADLGARL